VGVLGFVRFTAYGNFIYELRAKKFNALPEIVNFVFYLGVWNKLADFGKWWF
jgi:hypothetical protein